MLAARPEQKRNRLQNKNICYHCGEQCDPIPVLLDKKEFCCQGCKMVYEILLQNDLCHYYDLERTPGISLKEQKRPEYAWLEDREIQVQLIDYQNDKVSIIRFFLPAVHCVSCVWLLENLFKFNSAILNSKINFLKKELSISFDHHRISLRELAELLAVLGYPPEINLGDVDGSKKKKVNRKLIYQLGVAGFAFGNIMLLSFPEYLGLNEINAIGFQKWFGWLNILLALPVLFYSGKEYLRSAWLSIRQQNLNIDVPISIGMLTLFGRSIYEIISQTGAGYLDSLAGLVFFLLVGKWFQQITYHHLSFDRDYKSYFPVSVLRDDGTSIPIQNLKKDDVIIVKNKELIPADGFLLKGRAAIDYSFVTGEAEQISKSLGEQLYAGGKQCGEAIHLQINRTVSQSYLTQLWNDEAFKKKTINSTQLLADKIGKYFTWIILTIAFITLFYWLTIDVRTAINAFTAVLIIACPCAVALSIPFTLGNAIRILGRHGFYLKNTQVIEFFQKINTVVFDKTGTLTQTNQQAVAFVGTPLSENEQAQIAQLAEQSSHPLSQQIFQFFNKEKCTTNRVEGFEEITGNGIQGIVNQVFIKMGSAIFTVSLAVPEASVYLQINHHDRGYFTIQNTYRKGLGNLISFFKIDNEVHLLSGDNEKSKAELAPYFGTNLHYEQRPMDKLNFIKKLQSGGAGVLMIGDGLNDAGALKQSDVGIVVADNTNNFTPACDVILAADAFARLPIFIKYMKGCFRLIYVAYGLAFLYNIIGLNYAVRGELSPVIAAILMPASSVTIVLFGVLSSTILAWRLGLKSDEDHPLG